MGGVPFRSGDDLLRARLGPARESHPDEYDRTIRRLREAGVTIELRPGTLAYSPERGRPGRLILDPDASLGALRHEVRHFTDVRDAGYPGLGRYLADPDEFARLEENAYREEVALAESLGYDDLVPRILEQMRVRIAEILGG
ncbi:MAG: hypothetical protein K2X91_04585 [Thermoleophilia bacterium]|nr:hypothetical protein [Thermoleophilia bacterium]